MMTKKQKDVVDYLILEIEVEYHSFVYSENKEDRNQKRDSWLASKQKLVSYLDKIVLNEGVPESHFEFR